MSMQEAIASLVTAPESETLEFKAVLPPSRSMAQILCAFANTAGGHLILGISDSSGRTVVSGLSKDFHADEVTRRAIRLLSPSPVVEHAYVEFAGKRLFVVRVEKATNPVAIEGKVYRRQGTTVVQVGAEQREFRTNNFPRLERFSKQLETVSNATGAHIQFNNHIQSVLKIVDDLAALLYPRSATVPTDSREGRILARILFSSCADTFESYLSDLLYEIYLANPSTLRSNEQVTITDVLNCADIEEFVDVWARRKIGKLQRGSVKGFIADNKQISSLDVFDDAQQNDVESILQIRHLYSHKNGIVDDKFLKYFPGQFQLNQEHVMSIDAMVDKVEYLAGTVQRIDGAAVTKYNLATLT